MLLDIMQTFDDYIQFHSASTTISILCLFQEDLRKEFAHADADNTGLILKGGS